MPSKERDALIKEGLFLYTKKNLTNTSCAERLAMENSNCYIVPGVDIEEVDRFKYLCQRWGEKFLNRVFTAKELSYCKGKAGMYSHLAARFAAKEAVIKTIKKDKAPPLKTIEVVKTNHGKPQIILHREAKEMAEKLGIKCIEISLSHTKKFATAFVLTYFRGNPFFREARVFPKPLS